MFSTLFLSGALLQRAGLPLWVWLLLFLIVVLIVIFAAMANATKSGEDVQVHEAQPEPAPVPQAPATPDDLTKIEGIGPKISSVFQAAGITTFAAMAGSEVSALQQILDDAGIRLGNPETWPEQAKLAALGDWAALEKLQDELQGGRRT